MPATCSRSSSRSGVNVVLAGHKHVPYVWRLEDMYLASAGTCSSLRVRGHTKPCYNVLEIDGGEVTIFRKFPFGERQQMARVAIATGTQMQREDENLVQDSATVADSPAVPRHGRLIRHPPVTQETHMRTLALVDGEHYPPVTRAALEVAARARARGGGRAPGRRDGEAAAGASPRPRRAGARSPRATGCARSRDAIADLAPEAVLDLSDEPVLGYRERMELAAVALAAGVPYLGADFRLDPPEQRPPLPVPTLAVIGTGKRTGKTAIAGAVARLAARRGLEPVVVAMGRGGPAEPTVARAGPSTSSTSCASSPTGQHAASDYLEDAAHDRGDHGRRPACGRRARRARRTPRTSGRPPSWRPRSHPGLVILEGSGSAIPPVPWDAGILVVPATAPPEYLGGYLGPYRLLRSDLVVVTMAGDPSGSENLSALRSPFGATWTMRRSS